MVPLDSVDGQEVPFLEEGFPDGNRALGHVDLQGLAAGHAGLADAPGHHGRVGGLAAAAGQDPLGREKAVNILGLGLLPDQQDLLPLPSLGLGPVGIQHDLAGGGAGGGGDAGGQGLEFDVGIDLGMEELLQVFRFDAQQGLLLGDQALILHLHGGAHQGPGVHLPVPGLQAV